MSSPANKKRKVDEDGAMLLLSPVAVRYAFCLKCMRVELAEKPEEAVEPFQIDCSFDRIGSRACDLCRQDHKPCYLVSRNRFVAVSILNRLQVPRGVAGEAVLLVSLLDLAATLSDPNHSLFAADVAKEAAVASHFLGHAFAGMVSAHLSAFDIDVSKSFKDVSDPHDSVVIRAHIVL